MSTPFQKVLEFIENLDIRISSHGYDELAEDGLLVMDILSGVREARIVEDYPAYPKGPGVLILQKDLQGNPIHVLWGIPRDAAPPAVLITAYRPDPKYWSEDYM
ncbi:MAG: DUF4258 domain-containing protein, partial [bacterium]